MSRERQPKLTPFTQTEELFYIMTEGNPGACEVLASMFTDFDTFFDIYTCDELGIRGSKLYMLNNDCCGRDFNKFKRTLKMLKNGVFTDEEIYKNFRLCRAIPFIDDSTLSMNGVKPYEEDFGPGYDGWEEYCKANRDIFVPKLTKRYAEEEPYMQPDEDNQTL